MSELTTSNSQDLAQLVAARDTTLAATRDALVAKLDGAIDFQPMLEDRLPVGDIAADALAALQAQCLSDAQTWHAEYIARLKTELAREVYAGLSANEIAGLMSEEEFEMEERPGPAPMAAVIASVVANITVGSQALVIANDGTVLSDHPQVQTRMTAAIAATGETLEVLMTQPTIQVKTESLGVPAARICAGLPYALNGVTVELIAEALA